MPSKTSNHYLEIAEHEGPHMQWLMLALNMLTALPFVTEQASASSSMGYDLSISDQSYSAIDLGTISNGKEMTIDYSAEEDIDVLLLNLNQYTAWQSVQRTILDRALITQTLETIMYTHLTRQDTTIYCSITVIRIPRGQTEQGLL